MIEPYPRPIGNEHNLYSSYREALLEHLFAAEVMRSLWQNGIYRIEVLKPQVDDGGYDLVLEANGVVRHIQLKASHRVSSTRTVAINARLAEKPSGCVIWVIFDPETLELGPFRWFGGAPGEPLPDIASFKLGRHARGNAKGVKAERPGVRSLPKTAFDTIQSLSELITRLFGTIASQFS
jgi:hypothetical protein